MEHILEASNISKTYSEHKALQDVSINIPQGAIFGLLGPNGAGKTTFIRIITQIINADTGQIRFNGEILNPSHIGLIGYLPEERGLYKKMKVGEQLMYLAQLKGLKKDDAKARLKVWFQKLEMDGWWAKNVEDLSKGMQQKVQFISTVLHNPKLIILDEPFSGFDPVNANLIKDEILELNANGSTIIFSTHRMESVEELCDYLVMINKSKKILDGSLKSIKNEFRNQTYIVDHVGGLTNGQHFEIVEQSADTDGLTHSLVKTSKDLNTNVLLSELISLTEVHAFSEKVPSINEIFINKVKEGKEDLAPVL